MTTHLRTIIFVLGVVFGIIIGETSSYATEISVATTTIIILEVIVYFTSKKKGRASITAFVFLLLSLGVTLGVVRTQFVEEKSSITCPSLCQIEGVVVKKGDTKETYQVIDVEVSEDIKRIRVRVPLYPERSVGDRLVMQGVIQSPESIFPHGSENTFDYAMYLSLHDVGGLMYYPNVDVIPEETLGWRDQLQVFNAQLVARLHQYIEQPASYLASGMLLGVTNFSSELTERFRIAGLSHIVVLSGFNITILIVFILFLLRPFPVLIRVVGASLLVVTFVIMVGGGTSLVRASGMAGIALFALLLGRGYIATQALILSFLIIIIYSPFSLLHDVSLHLSFLATAGIVYGYVLAKKVLASYLPPFVTELLSATLAAYLFTLPYILYTFGTLPVYAVIANLVVLPLVPVTMSFTALTLLTSFISSHLALALGFITDMLASSIIALTRLVSDLPFAKVEVHISFISMTVLYLVLGLIMFFLKVHKKNETLETKNGEIISPVMSF